MAWGVREGWQVWVLAGVATAMAVVGILLDAGPVVVAPVSH